MSAGDHRAQYTASAGITVTSLASLPSSSGLVAGWTSGGLSNGSALDLVRALAGQFVLGSGTIAANSGIELWAYTRLDDSTWPDLFSSGTEGSQGTATVHSREALQAAARPVWLRSVETGTPTNRTYAFPQIPLHEIFGFTPKECALFLVHNTNQNLAASGHAINVFGQSSNIAQS